jgi:magnesium transporter
MADGGQFMDEMTDIPNPHDVELADLGEENRLSGEFVRSVLEAADHGDSGRARELVGLLRKEDIADLFEQVEQGSRAPLAQTLGDLVTAEVLAEMNDWVRDDLIEVLNAAQIAELTEQLDTDDAVAIISELDVEDQRAVLAELDAEDRLAIGDALAYPEESAGRIMQRDLVAVPEHFTVGQLIDFLREHDDLTTELWEIFVVDPAYKPIGTCQLSWILRTPRSVAIGDVMKREQTLIPADMDQEEVALRFQKYNLISTAVVDADGRLAGMITVDDILHIVEEEASEDILRLSGAGDGDINEPIRDSYIARVRWLIANLATALVASSVIALFGGAIEQMVALAVLMPIVASLGGNAGTQTMAVTVRALAMNKLTASNTWRIVRRELTVAVLNGGTIALLIGSGTALLFANPLLGAVIALAMLVNIIIAGAAGIFVPITLERLDQDPALASSVFVTMITDTMGFLAFLGLAVASGLVSLS